jgi:predicted nucleotidyltransferase
MDVEKVKLSNCNLNLNKFKEIISICTFGSYNEPCFDKDRSDIDVMILSKKELHWEEEMEIEDYLQTILPDYFNHKDIHYTFINDFVYPFSEMLIESKDKIIIQEEEYLDYILGYSCFKRDREYLEIIRESNLKYLEECKNGLL